MYRLGEPHVEIDGIKGFKPTELHFDVNGKWGGHKAVVAHFIPTESDDKSNQIMYLYILVGGYHSVGSWPGDEAPSIWQTVRLLTGAIEEGIDINRLYQAISLIIKRERNKKEE